MRRRDWNSYQSYLRSGHEVTLGKCLRYKRWVSGHKGLFWAVAYLVVFVFSWFAAFATLCPFLIQFHLNFVEYLCGFSFVWYVCVWLIQVFIFLFCCIFLFVCVLVFQILPTINHGKSKDGIQPFKGPKPAARIANSLENREYWAAYRDWHTPTLPSSLSWTRLPAHPNRHKRIFPETNT